MGLSRAVELRDDSRGGPGIILIHFCIPTSQNDGHTVDSYLEHSSTSKKLNTPQTWNFYSPGFSCAINLTLLMELCKLQGTGINKFLQLSRGIKSDSEEI